MMLRDIAHKVPSQRTLSSVRTLRLIGGQSELELRRPRWQMTSNNCWIVKSTFGTLCPSLQTVEIFDDHEVWSVPDTTPVYETGATSDVSCLNSRTLGFAAVNLAKQFPRARKLTLKVSGRPIPITTVDHFTLESGLLRLADTLEYLHLEIPWKRFAVQELGEYSRLTLLPRLHRLKHLQVQVGALCPRSEPRAENQNPLGTYSLADNLPNSLESLYLAENLADDSDKSVSQCSRSATMAAR
ncbi:hypothetical protein BJ170DRAFT_485738 [Xylariales sp. AK1849]|nr:hypothetical protein BJ170DRAFT_485738 [Xylariales sp. AK1849]